MDSYGDIDDYGFTFSEPEEEDIDYETAEEEGIEID